LEEVALEGVPADDRAPQAGQWRNMPVTMLPLPLQLVATPGASGGSRVPFAIARSWARDLEMLATVRHPNLRPLLGITLGSVKNGIGSVTLVYEAGRATTLFEWVHASLPDGSRRTIKVREELQVCIGICEGLKVLASQGLVCGSLCSVNVEVLKAPDGNGLTTRLARVGSCWWRWGWRSALSVRESGQVKRRAMSVDEVVRKYGSCPVNWLAPEVLRAEEPAAPADVYAFGLVLWELLYRAIPFGDYSIAQLLCTIGHGRRKLRTSASSGASTETTFLHEAVARCAHWDAASRPSASVMLGSLRDVMKSYEKRKAEDTLENKTIKMVAKTEKLGMKTLVKTERLAEKALGKELAGMTKGLLQTTGAILHPPVPACIHEAARAAAGEGRGGGGEAAASAASAASQQAAGGEAEEDPDLRMVRLESGEWVRVHADLIEQFPGDEEKWRTLMAFRARLPSASADGG